MNTFFTSDTHFFHKKMVEKCRPQFSTEEDPVLAMNEALIYNWNNVVGQDDLIYHLGDVSFGKTAATAEIIARLNGHKILILGNHDHGKSRTAWKRMGFEEIYDSGHLKFSHKGYKFLLSHFPYEDGQIERHVEKYGNMFTPDGGLALICGHVHQEYKTAGKRMVNVGVDAWDLSPISVEQVIEAYREAATGVSK